MKKVWTTPAGDFYNLYADMLEQTHLLIGGASGSGKSVVINGIIATALLNAPGENDFILIDPKRVELSEYKNLPHCIRYASEPADMIDTLQFALCLIENRYKTMQKTGQRKYTGGHVYVVIDELADLMTTARKQVEPLIQRICQVGRAANVHMIAATQCPLSAVIPTPIKVNFDSVVALRTRCRQDSRNIAGFAGCEELPRYGQGYYIKPEGTTLYNIPMVDDTERQRLISYWMKAKPIIKLFAR